MCVCVPIFIYECVLGSLCLCVRVCANVLRACICVNVLMSVCVCVCSMNMYPGVSGSQ